jgi:pSer/pThr/pTyr-binding forkhead associated (FHA) protein
MKNSLSKNWGLTDGQTYIISRSGPVSIEGHIYMDSPSVSRPHASIKIKNGRVHIRDLDSTNGTYIVENDSLVAIQEGYVKPNQPIMIGRVKCTINNLLSIAGVYSAREDDTPDFEDTQKIAIPTEHKPFKSWL